MFKKNYETTKNYNNLNLSNSFYNNQLNDIKLKDTNTELSIKDDLLITSSF